MPTNSSEVSPVQPSERVRHLGRGDLRTQVTEHGGGVSSFKDLQINVCRPDEVQDVEGWYFYLRDRQDDLIWTATPRPIPSTAEGDQSVIHADEVRFVRRVHGISSELSIRIDEQHSVELRTLRVTNESGRTRELEIASLMEVAFDQPAPFAAHPVFSKLFLQTSYVGAGDAVAIRRRPRSQESSPATMVVALFGPGDGDASTDRAEVIGRGRSLRNPASLSSSTRPLSGRVGNVLDPCVCHRRRLRLDAGATAEWTAALTVGDKPESLWSELLEAVPIRPARVASIVAPAPPVESTAEAEPPHRDPSRSADRLVFYNGLGGFDEVSREYRIRLESDARGGLRLPPQPWANVLANPEFGVLVSETGTMTAWKTNSRLFRLTPWPNDPLTDPHCETLHLHDDDTGETWSLWPGPTPSSDPYDVAHGFGYTRCRHVHGQLDSEALVFVSVGHPARIVRVQLRNQGAFARRLRLSAFSQLVLGSTPQESADQIRFDVSEGPATLRARSIEDGDFAQEIVFSVAKTDLRAAALRATCDRHCVLGERGDLRQPQPLPHDPAMGLTAEGGPDPCFAQEFEIELGAGQSGEFTFLLASTAETDTPEWIEDFEPGAAVETELTRVREFWKRELGALQIETPSKALDTLVNGWLLYQTLSCRLNGRTATYQSGGAFGFRDQLQDSGAFLLTNPRRTREQILLHAAHQFPEGDVLHWWHPPTDAGIRTRFVDDLLWLPLLTAEYVESTGDTAILDEVCPYVNARTLASGEDEVFLQPVTGKEKESLFEHCLRAIDRSLGVGSHGLPLFGTGDWNDGMNRVGRDGRGESVWMAFFLVAVLDRFTPLCEMRGETRTAAEYRTHRQRLASAANDAGWDGEWYRRGYYDDGSPLGSAQSDECRIDALAQAWSVLSGVANTQRREKALCALETHLISQEEGLIRLLRPAFRNTPHDPGYIRGYVAGVRENGGQYTHAAMWVIQAFAQAGRRDRVAALLDLVNPISHTSTPQDVARYQGEPYAVAADVYGETPHIGRAGWTWYTGSSGWMFRAAVESLIGLRRIDGQRIQLNPCLPSDWPEARVRLRLPGDNATTYEIRILQDGSQDPQPIELSIDGVTVNPVGAASGVGIFDDGGVHEIVLRLGSPLEEPCS